MYGVGRVVVVVQGHKSTREVHFANWIVPPLSASNDSEATSQNFSLLFIFRICDLVNLPPHSVVFRTYLWAKIVLIRSRYYLTRLSARNFRIASVEVISQSE